MSKKIITLLSPHPVYESILYLFGIVSKKISFILENFSLTYNNTRVLEISSTAHIYHTPMHLSKRNLYVFRSPMICVDTWSSLIQSVPCIICEEYYYRGNRKNTFAKFIVSNFRRLPFIAQTKRSKVFLEDSRIVTFFVPPAEKRKLGKKERKHILFVSKLLGSKNPLLFVNLARAFPKEKFIIIGKGEMLPQIHEEAQSIRNLEIIPYVESRDRLFRYYANAKLLVHPAWKDPIGHVIIEALSTQTPVLASRDAGASDFLPKEWALDPKDEEVWTRKVKYILKHQEESIKKAEETFEKEHLNIDDPYFEKVAGELAAYIKKRWPHLFKNP